MAAVHSDDGDGDISAINVTPFVDIVLVLLIILMVTSTEIARQAIMVNLPSAASAGAAVPPTLNLVIQADGSIHLDGVPMQEPALDLAIAQATADSPDLRAVISADRTVAYQRVVHVIDLVKQRGVSKFALDIVPGATP